MQVKMAPLFYSDMSWSCRACY